MKISKKVALYISWSILAIAAYYTYFAPKLVPVPLKAPFARLSNSIGGWSGRNISGQNSFTAAIVTCLGSDDFLMREYEDAGGAKGEIYMSYFNYTKVHKTPHAPQLCWVGSGWTLIDLGEEDLVIDSARYPSIKIRKMLGEKDGEKVLLLYTYKVNDRYVADLSKFRIISVIDSILRRKNSAFTIQLYSQLGNEAINKKEAEMKGFLSKLFGLLEKDYLP